MSAEIQSSDTEKVFIDDFHELLKTISQMKEFTKEGLQLILRQFKEIEIPDKLGDENWYIVTFNILKQRLGRLAISRSSNKENNIEFGIIKLITRIKIRALETRMTCPSTTPA